MNIIYDNSAAVPLAPETFDDKITHIIIDAELFDVSCIKYKKGISILFKFIGKNNMTHVVDIDLDESFDKRKEIVHNLYDVVMEDIMPNNKNTTIIDDELAEMIKVKYDKYRYND